MKDPYKPLQSSVLNSAIDYCRPDNDITLTRDDPASSVMTDFRSVRAITTSPDTSIVDCNQHMIINNVRLLLVRDAEKKVLGVITAADILGEKPFAYMQKTGVGRDEVLVRNIMTPVTALETLELSDVEEASIGDIVKTLIKYGRQHAIVTCKDHSSGRRTICGIFSATQIGKQLGVHIEPVNMAGSFAELGKVIVS